MKTAVRTASSLALVCAVLTLTACGRSEPPPLPPPVVANPVDPATAGTVTGTVRFEGRAPAPVTINAASDPYCERQGTLVTEAVRVSADNSLQNVFVYVKEGLDGRQFPVPSTPAVLDQRGCQYAPRVLGVQVGQSLDILSSDDTLHNVHAMPEHNREFNKAHQAAGVRHTHVFSTREVMVPFKCDVHKWMNAYLGVLDHPYFAVTGEDGTFELPNLPPGTYTIEAWHETLGTQTQTVTIGEKQTGTVGFVFKA